MHGVSRKMLKNRKVPKPLKPKKELSDEETED
jgi:hypothetical protein